MGPAVLGAAEGVGREEGETGKAGQLFGAA